MKRYWRLWNKGSTGNSSTNSSTNNSAVNNSSSQVVDETIQKPAQNAASGENTENTVVKTGIVKASALNVRQGPGTSYSIINQLSNGAKVNIIKEESGWYQIKLANGFYRLGFRYICECQYYHCFKRRTF